MRALASACLVSLLVACGGAPELPPDDTMTVDFSGLEQDGALVDPTKKTHWGQAVVRVALLNGWVTLGLAAPVATFKAARSQRAAREGGSWVWNYTVKTANVDATATLTATPDGAGWLWEMRVDGKVGAAQHDDFLWYEGRSEDLEGHWQFHDAQGKVLRIDWRRAAPLDRQLKFTNNTGREGDGQFVDYLVDGETASVTYDLGAEKKAQLQWSLASHEGFILADDFAGHEKQKACWNAELFDAECPAE